MNEQQRRPKGEGSIYQRTLRGVTYWQAAQSIMTEQQQPDGSTQRVRKRVTGTGASKQEAWRKLSANLARFHAAGAPAPTPRVPKAAESVLTVEHWVRGWAERLRYEERVTPTVHQKYLRALELHVIPHIGGVALTELTHDDCAKLVEETLPSKTKPDGSQLLSPAGRRNIYKPLNVALNDAVNRNKLTHNPMNGVRQPQQVRKNEAVNERASYAGTLMLKLRTHPDEARHLLAFLGLRRSERLGLTWDKFTGIDDEFRLRVEQQLARHIDGSGYYINTRLKTRSSIRTLPVPEPFLGAMLRYQKIQDEWKKSPEWQPEEQFANLIFTTKTGKPITQNRDNSDWHQLLAAFGLPDWRGHLNRHITATMLAKQNPPIPVATVKEVLGHNSESMTLYYQELDPMGLIAPMKQYGQFLSESAELIENYPDTDLSPEDWAS